MKNNSPNSLSFEPLDKLIGYHLRRAQSAVFSDFRLAMSDDQITPGQYGVLSLIEANKGLNQTTLSKAIGIERSTMVAVIDLLEKRNLVARHKSPTDKRSYALDLTNAGKKLLKKVTDKVDRHEKNISTNLTETETKTLISLLKRVAAPEAD